MEDLHKKYAKNLTNEERMLITLRDELYAASWDDMEQDLKDRLQGKPYIFRLVNKIEDDLKRIAKLHAYEKKHNINLSDFL